MSSKSLRPPHSPSVCAGTEKAMNKFKDQLDATEKEKVSKLVTELCEIATKGQADDGSVNTALIHSETQQTLLGHFQKIYKKRAAENSSDKPAEGSTEKNIPSCRLFDRYLAPDFLLAFPAPDINDHDIENSKSPSSMRLSPTPFLTISPLLALNYCIDTESVQLTVHLSPPGQLRSFSSS